MNQLLISFAIKLSTRRSKISLRGDLEQLNDVCTDFHLFKSILYHLMQNAIKHSPPDNSIDIEIKLKPLPRQSANLTGFLEVTIRDYGLGFNASSVLSRDFKTFQLAGSNQTEI
jgi:signal transduction histidine kinase